MHSHANKSHIWPQPPHRFISRAIKSVPVKNFNRWQPRHDPFATIYVPKILLFLPLNRCRSFGGVHVRVSVCFLSFRPRCPYFLSNSILLYVPDWTVELGGRRVWGRPRFDYIYGGSWKTLVSTPLYTTLRSSLGLRRSTYCIEDWILCSIWGDYFDLPLDIGGVDNLQRIGNEDRLAYQGCHENLHCGMLCTWYVCKLFLK